MIVHHWSRVSGLTVTDPSFAGTGIRGAERDRAQVKGTYFGESGYRERSVQANRYEYQAELDEKTLYFLDLDPKGLALTAQRNAQASGNNAKYEFELLVIESGYIGYRAQSVVKVFQPVTVTRI